jgi:hypothetical protein
MTTSNANETEKGSRCGKGRHCWRIPFIILGIVLIKSAITLFLWNALVPDLFHGPVINYLQAVGLVVLAKVLFGGHRGHHGHHGPPWRRWDGLSPEERAKLREEMRNRCC